MSMVWPTLGSRTNRTEQNRTSADNVALPAFAAARRAAARLMLTVGPPAVQQSIDISWPPAHSSKPAAAACGGQVGQTDRQTVPDSCINPASYTKRAVSITLNV